MGSKQFPKKPELQISIPAKTELLKMVVDLTKHMAAINNFDVKESQKIALAVDEAITNVIKHSYKNIESKDIKIEFYSTPVGDEKGIKIILIFTGEPPILEGVTINLNKMIKAGKKGGLGVELMKRIMDSVEYKTVNKKNYCEMIKWASP